MHPQVGHSFISGRLRSPGYGVARERVRHVAHICDPLDAALRWQGIVHVAVHTVFMVQTSYGIIGYNYAIIMLANFHLN